jgi:hypothetical protein
MPYSFTTESLSDSEQEVVNYSNTATLSLFKSWPVAEQALMPARNLPMIFCVRAMARAALLPFKKSCGQKNHTNQKEILDEC